MKRPGQKLCHFPAFLLAALVCCYATSGDNRMVVEPPKKPFNISCITNATKHLDRYTICYWNNAGNSWNTIYRVTMKQKYNFGNCTSELGQSYCRLSTHPRMYADNTSITVTVTVTAQNSVGNASATVHFHPFEIDKVDPPKTFWVKPLPTGLRVEWDENDYGFKKETCQVQHGKIGTNVKIVSNKTTHGERAVLVGDVKPCTNYTVAMRCAYVDHGKLSMWTDWSIGTPVLSWINVSSLPFYLWGNILETFANGTRHVQLMWKGISPSCNAIDEYKLSVNSKNLQKNATEHYDTVSLNATHKEITIAAYKNGIMLRNSSLKIPFTVKDMPPVQRPIATAHDGLIHVCWDAPLTPVKYYVIEWFTSLTEPNRPSWNRTQDTNISFRGDLPYELYTVTITPLYDDGPGQRSTMHTYAKQGAPAKVTQVKKFDGDATSLTVGWEAVRRDQCCGFVVSYTVFYRASTESKENQLNVTTQQVTLKDLHRNTRYLVHVRANSIDNSSDSGPFNFKTEAYGKAFIKTLVYVVIGLVLLLVFAVGIFMLRRKVLNLMVPNPQFSSMAMWNPEKSLKLTVFNNVGMENSPHSDSIALCQVDTETDTKLASPENTLFILSNLMEDRMGSSIVASETSGNSEVLLLQSKNSDEAAESLHQQPNQPFTHNHYLHQIPVEPLTAQEQQASLADQAKTVVKSSEQITLNPVSLTTAYITEDMLVGQNNVF